jgi:hypothetical protein
MNTLCNCNSIMASYFKLFAQNTAFAALDTMWCIWSLTGDLSSRVTRAEAAFSGGIAVLATLVAVRATANEIMAKPATRPSEANAPAPGQQRFNGPSH